MNNSDHIPDPTQALKDTKARVPQLVELGNIESLLFQALNEEDYQRQHDAAHALWKLGDPAAVEPLIQALNESESEWIRGNAAKTLGLIRDRAAVPALTQTLQTDEDECVREEAAAALGLIRDRTAVPALTQTLQTDEDEYVRGEAAVALGLIKDHASLPVLLQAMKDVGARARAGATYALSEIGDCSVIPALTQALKDVDEGVRGQAVQALSAIKHRLNLNPGGKIRTTADLELVKKIVTAVQTGTEYSVLILDNPQEPLHNCVLVYPGVGQLTHGFTELEAKDIADFIRLAPQIITKFVADLEKGATLIKQMQELLAQFQTVAR